jgi:hypothetical protein
MTDDAPPDNLFADTATHPDHNGYSAAVFEKNDKGRITTVVYDSLEEHGPQGLFHSQAEAADYATARLAAELDRRQRVATLKQVRGRALAGRIAGNFAKTDALTAEKKEIANAIKSLADETSRLVSEAHRPDVWISMPLGTHQWSLVDAPSLSEKTLGTDPRQLSLPQFAGDNAHPPTDAAPKRKAKGKPEQHVQ